MFVFPFEQKIAVIAKEGFADDLEFFVAPTELRFPKILYALGEVAIEVLAVTA